MIKFISPITVEENFMLKTNTLQQEYYINYIPNDLFEKIVVLLYNYMKQLPPEGLKYYLKKSDFLYDKINYISIQPILINKKLCCQTNVYTTSDISDFHMGILKDFLQDELATHVNTYMIVNDIEYNFNTEYYKQMQQELQQQNLKYTVKLNFFDYNNFYIEQI